MTVYIENPMDLRSEFGNIEGYKVNIQKSMALLYTKVVNYQETLGGKIPCTIATTKKIKYLGINLTEQVKDLY